MNNLFNFDLDKFVCPLQVAFIVLKLLGKITWSWIWVLSPLWIGVVFWIVVAILAIWLVSS